MINMMKNASTARNATVTFPYSNVKMAILECLKDEHFISSITKKTIKKIPSLEVELIYDDQGRPKITTTKRVSKPSRRLYASVKELKGTRRAHGTTVLSTPKGILTEKQARREQVGGEILFIIS